MAAYNNVQRVFHEALNGCPMLGVAANITAGAAGQRGTLEIVAGAKGFWFLGASNAQAQGSSITTRASASSILDVSTAAVVLTNQLLGGPSAAALATTARSGLSTIDASNLGFMIPGTLLIWMLSYPLFVPSGRMLVMQCRAAAQITTPSVLIAESF